MIGSPKISVKDSFEDDEMSDDIEDEVFIRDGKNGFKFDDEIGVKRPLMAPRRKFKYNNLHSPRCKKPFPIGLRIQCNYGITFIAIFLGITLGVIIMFNLMSSPLDQLRQWAITRKNDLTVVPCSDFRTQHIWQQSFSQLKTESALTSFDANGDNILDIVIGFSTDYGIEESEMPRKCSSFDAIKNCGGGVLVLDGKTGSLLWKYWTRKDVLFIDCSQNVNADKTKDCLISGKGGVLGIVDGKTGILIWEFTKSNIQYLLDLYSAQYIVDQNGDGFSDILISHTTDQSSYIIILNGKNGEAIGQVGMPDGGSVFTVPRLIQTYNNTYVIFATGSIETSGSLFIIPLESISNCDLSKSKTIWKGSSSVSSGILIADMNGDDIEDVIFTYGDTLSILDGRDFTFIRNFTLKESGNSQILIGPTPAYFNNDAYPDLLITNMVGSTFPEYYFSESRIASGDSGKFLLDEPILGSGEITSPAIAVSFSGVGNDMFLFWSSTCGTSKSNQKQKFTFTKGTTLYEKTHSDLCRLRFNSSLDVQLYLLSEHIEPPGVLLYSSRNLWDNNTENMAVTAKPFIVNHSHEGDQSVNSLHKNQHKSHFSSQSSDEKKNAFNFGKYVDGGNSDKSQWNIPYDDNMPVLPSVNLGELAMKYEASYQDRISNDEGRDEKMSYGKEMKRFANYQAGLLPRARSTVTLVDAINATGIDIIFAIYWETPLKDVRILTQKEQACIHKKLLMEQAASKLNNLELEVAEERAERACINVRREDELEVESDKMEEEDIKVSDGMLTIHRLRLSCSCSQLSNSEQCSEPMPLEAQSYPARASHTYFLGKHIQHQFLSR